MKPSRKHDVKWFFACGKPWHKKWWIWLIGVILIILLVAIPFIINCAYMKGLTLESPNTAFSASDLLSFYGTVLTFAGTVALSALALWQNKQIALKSQEYTELMERNERKRNLPVLKISLGGRNGSLSNLFFIVNNYSENIATFSEVTPFTIYNKSGEKICSSSAPSLDKAMVMGGESTKIRFSNAPFQANYCRIEFEIYYIDKFADIHSLRITGTEINIANNSLSIQQEEIN